MILRRNEGDRFSTVVREWEGETAAILASGPSLTVDQVESVKLAHKARKLRCIAVNDTYLWAPWADVLYFADARWWQLHSKGIEKRLLGLKAEDVRKRLAEFPGQKCSIRASDIVVTDESVHVLLRHHSENNAQGLSRDPRYLSTGNGKNSAMQAVNVATLAGAAKVILLGLDGRPGADGRQNFHGGHPWPTPSAFYDAMRRGFSEVERELESAGVEVVNCSPGSAIDSFPKMELSEALA